VNKIRIVDKEGNPFFKIGEKKKLKKREKKLTKKKLYVPIY
jgi:hypothetical protein